MQTSNTFQKIIKKPRQQWQASSKAKRWNGKVISVTELE